MLVGYARVSTTDQSLDIQREALVAAGCEKLFEEKRSGTTTDGRTELADALDWVRDGDVLVVTRLDRLARSVGDLHSILNALERKGVGFRCLQQPVDTTSPTGRLMMTILGAVAEFETDLRKERQMEGIAKAKAEGRYRGGRPSKATEHDIRTLRIVEGLGAAEIARKLGISTQTVYRRAPGIWDATPEHLKR